jgi:hydrogenase nickel incorporation protein HypA/HybF
MKHAKVYFLQRYFKHPPGNVRMHELPVMKSILDIVLKQAAIHNVRSVRAVQLEVGLLSDLEAQWMQRYFDYLSRGTLAQEAELKIQWNPIVFRCQECGKSFEAERKMLPEVACPACGRKHLSLVSGREYRIRNLVGE